MSKCQQLLVKTSKATPSATLPAHGAMLHRKVRIGQLEEKNEVEADRVADQFMSTPELGLQHDPARSGNNSSCLDKDGVLEIKPHSQQRVTVGEVASEAPPVIHEVLRSPGRPLDPSTLRSMETHFGHDFSQVKVHTDAKASESAQQVGALAYTVGQHIVFGPGEYVPSHCKGRELLAHELTHVLQQRQSFNSGNTGEKALEQEASTNTARVMCGKHVSVTGSAKTGSPQFRRVQQQGRTFEVGDMILHGRASEDVRRHGVLLPGPDQGHILVTGRGELGYEVSHTDPADPFRWNKLKQIVDNGHVDIHAVQFPGSFRVKEVNGPSERVTNQTLFAVGGSGITLVRSSIHRRIYPAETRFIASPSDERDTIYYQSGTGGRGIAGDNALAHELLGHLWLSMQGVPFLHPESPEEARRRAEQSGQTLTPTEYAQIAVREQRLGMLGTSHGIRDPFGRVFTGRVREYIDRFVGSSISPLQSPSQRVSEAHLRQALADFRSAALARDGLVRSGTSWQASDAVGLQWEYLSNNYEILASSGQATPGNFSSSTLRRELLTFYQRQLNSDQQYVLRQFLSEVITGIDTLSQFRLTRLASDLQSDIRALRTSTP